MKSQKAHSLLQLFNDFYYTFGLRNGKTKQDLAQNPLPFHPRKAFVSRNKRPIPIVDFPTSLPPLIAIYLRHQEIPLSEESFRKFCQADGICFFFLVSEFVSEEKRGKLSPGESRQLCCECNQQILG